MLNQEQIEFYQQNGYLKVEALFTESEVHELSSDMVQVIENWGNETIGWQGPWRDHYLDQEERLNTKAVFMHNPHFYSSAWGRVIFNQKLVGSVQDLISNNVQWHHTVLHAKPPGLGTPFQCIKIILSTHMMDWILSIVYFIWMIRLLKAAVRSSTK